MICATISWYSAGPIITPDDRITVSDCVNISGNQVHPTGQILLPNNDNVFQDDSSPIHIARSV
jgi:hypothetical protein